MNNSMPVHRIDIPNRAVANEAADIVIAKLRSLGVDPRKAYRNEMMIALVLEWSRGGMDDAGFEQACQNMLIFNPGLAL